MDRQSIQDDLRSGWVAFASRNPRAAALLQTLAIGAQLLVFVAIVRLFDIETQGFLQVAQLASVGFLVHALLPRPLRLYCFCALSLLAVVVVLGPVNAAWLLGAGGVLIGLCHAPLPFGARVAAVAGFGGLLALWRGHYLAGPIPEAVWPILGSMFMFRLIHYLYDLRHRKESPSGPWTFAYFFMLPNVCFPLFPVVDYARFRTTYYSDDAHRIYQRGMGWIFRGLLHLLLYRAVYYHVTLAPSEVATTAQLVQYALGAFFLYLRVSGYFHLIVGMLLLFGFNLPETHHLYFLASSFSDFWRRINIYWKDFMMKLFYYPAYFRLRRFGPTPALVLSTAVVFVGTWALHSYQWFWLRGSWLFEAHDALFWGILGVAMIANSLWEQRYGRRRSLSGARSNAWARAATALRTLATFMVLCTLWSLWSSDSLTQWIELWRETDSGWLAALLAVAVPALVVASWGLDRLADRQPPPQRRPAAREPFFWADAARTAMPALALALLGLPAVFGRLGPQVAGAVESVREPGLNARDAELLERGYYEHLIAVNHQNAELWKLYSGKPSDWVPIIETPAWRAKNDMLLGELVPGTDITWLGQPLHINHSGFRDRDYEQSAPPGTLRIAILGSSHVFGFGVGDADVFENVLEQRLNREAGREGAYEVLNFAVPNQNAVMNIEQLRTKALASRPHVVIAFAHTHDDERIRRYVPELLDAVELDAIPYPYLRDLLHRLEVDRDTPVTIAERRVAPHVDEILDWAYREIVALSRSAGARPVFVLIPTTHERSTEEGERVVAAWLERARAAGFEVLSVVDAYDGHTPEELKVAPWDNHPNALGHRLLADRIYEQLSAADLLRPPEAPRAAEATQAKFSKLR